MTDNLQIQLVELSKSRATAHNLSQVSPLERRAFFLRHAGGLNAETVRELLPEPEFAEAVGVLEMIARTPEQELLYHARLKFQRDEAARLEHARAEGWQEGEQIGQARGEQIGQERLLEQLLGLTPTTSDELAKLNSKQLATQITVLQRQLRERAR